MPANGLFFIWERPRPTKKTMVSIAGSVVHGDSNDLEIIISCVIESLAGSG